MRTEETGADRTGARELAWSRAVCHTNGIGIHYTRTGGDLLPLILLHGLAADGTCWTDLARTLQADFDVIMPDARGHGQSDAPVHGYRYEDHTNDVVGLIRALRLTSPILVGHSMGGMTAAVVADQYPVPLRALILSDPTFLSAKLQREVYENNVADQHRRMLTMSFGDLVADARARHPDRSPELVEIIVRARLRTSINAFDVLRPPNPDYLRLMGSIDVPMLLVTGENGVVSPEVAAELQSVNPGLKVAPIPDAGHGLHYDQPEFFATAVKSFLRSLS